MPSELLQLIKCTGAVHDSDDVAIPAGFVDIGVENSQHLKKFHDEVVNKLFDDEWEKSGIRDRRQLNGSKSSQSDIASFPIHFNSIPSIYLISFFLQSSGTI